MSSRSSPGSESLCIDINFRSEIHLRAADHRGIHQEHPMADAAAPFHDFAEGLAPAPTPLRAAITAAWRRPEPEAVAALLPAARQPHAAAQAAQALARRLAQGLRDRPNAGGRAGLVQNLLQQYALSSQEGVALMCLAEALLRIPDAATRDALIRDKIAEGQWQSHLGQSASVFVNAATWGLLLTGKLVATHSERGLSTLLTRLLARGGEPLIRKSVDLALRMMGEQFVAGETIAEALQHARSWEREGFRYSYDMLGEAALTAHDAERYRQAYAEAIDAIGTAAAGRGVLEGPGISIKLSALHPRYQRAQRGRVLAELYPVLRDLALQARGYDIGLNIDAEEADRLELSLDLLERLCHEPGLSGWNGIGFVVQAYQKRCPHVIDFIVDLARRSGHRLMVRLVKGAYWDSEIKRAQEGGLADYPVYTRKVHTDLAYLACARRLLAAPDAVYPQFATHNAHTLAAIVQMADPARWQRGQYEFQCLHGMGEPLYQQVVEPLKRPCRIYAPVGTHETLLAYLVRRLLENGANTSFVHRIADAEVPLDDLVEDPVATVERAAAAEGQAGLPHPAIALPPQLYGADRRNALGLDLASDDQLRALQAVLADSAAQTWQAAPLLAEELAGPDAATAPVRNPADHGDTVGQVRAAQPAEIEAAVAWAAGHAPAWAAVPPAERAARLEHAAGLLEAHMPVLLGLLMREAGKTAANGVAEVREAVDFLRYYAAQARRDLGDLGHQPLGSVVCISPWNFPLAIFTGQVAAALAAGNTVLAKPAEQTPLVAAEAVRLLWQAGLPRAAVQLLPGPGETVGAALVADARVQGVLFTGSTEVARLLQRQLAQRLNADGAPVPLIAETGGQNAMVVDSSALAEQVVADAVASAFDSAGQRCSALRVLCLQDDVAERTLQMLQGAMAELQLGNPGQLAVDVGPVIDEEARSGIERHVAAMQARGRRVHRLARGAAEATARGSFVVPTLIEIDSLAELQREVFGPVLHVLRWRQGGLDALLAQVNATGYGLTLGLHTRIDETIAQVAGQAHAGNIYVNRNIVGAVVGVQPFGGEGLSGTGPKAGGPLYLYRLLRTAPADPLVRAMGGPAPAADAELLALQQWAQARGDGALAQQCAAVAAANRSGTERVLPGPTGERNSYRLSARGSVLCLADGEEGGDARDAALLAQLAAVLAVGGHVVWPADAGTQALHARLPEAVRARTALAADWTSPDVHLDAALHQGTAAGRRAAQQALAARPGAIVALRALQGGDAASALPALVLERALSVNTAAAGGNASLMAIG
ncbi:trifunctional transcriptional regulator/proline dehydrogenase/L-glutamate gamma-semialdehyde dehydrogenase [Pseudorhodoferax sp.]|uniref:trifunctional transcriptional regulator/proline dehydrogenase/L-glutamate gamma-semialdehyde dehydrogenase n=1 Tax=Pseudorhodoferax sp. TaxID=1993553 RepID=UPI003FA787B9